MISTVMLNIRGGSAYRADAPSDDGSDGVKSLVVMNRSVDTQNIKCEEWRRAGSVPLWGLKGKGSEVRGHASQPVYVPPAEDGIDFNDSSSNTMAQDVNDACGPDQGSCRTWYDRYACNQDPTAER